MSRPTVLLLAPPVLYAGTWWSSKVASKPHLYSLAGFVRDIADVRITELDVNTAPRPDDVARFLDDIDEQLAVDDIDLVGISCWTILHYLGAVALARKIRARRRALPIVVGGHHPTAVPSEFVRTERLFDFVVRGDGEHVLRGLLEAPCRRPPDTEVTVAPPYQMCFVTKRGACRGRADRRGSTGRRPAACDVHAGGDERCMNAGGNSAEPWRPAFGFEGQRPKAKAPPGKCRWGRKSWLRGPANAGS